ncbi:hypothetical protein Clacol_002844 [Clathrus columnatus]|uniref:Uncharacterized protein n=1 Tax=Clathrus columnatus TaxID=1419009 RepID=A0AAV5A300_9AGAM|nr:hypothetical protein Clacol_002844 [Clathrus columnatus]
MHYGSVQSIPSSSSQSQTDENATGDSGSDRLASAVEEGLVQLQRRKQSSLWQDVTYRVLFRTFSTSLTINKSWQLIPTKRGVTMAPRVDVYTQIACDEIRTSAEANLIDTPGPRPPFRPLIVYPSEIHPQVMPLSANAAVISNSHVDILLSTDNSVDITFEIPKECLDNPVVHSRAAQIQATLGTVVGVLSIVTAGYWGQVSDAYGRKTVLSTVLFGMLFHHIIYILVDTPNTIFNRYAWKFLILGPFVEGLLGGLTTYHAAENAFLADCANSGSRSTIFSYFQGASYIALASGPQIAPILLKDTTTNPRTPMFYAGLALETMGFFYALLILPETVSKETMMAARNAITGRFEGESFTSWIVRRTRETRDKLLSPLRIFAPKRRPSGGWEFSMTLLVVAQFIHLMSAVSSCE